MKEGGMEEREKRKYAFGGARASHITPLMRQRLK